MKLLEVTLESDFRDSVAQRTRVYTLYVANDTYTVRESDDEVILTTTDYQIAVTKLVALIRNDI